MLEQLERFDEAMQIYEHMQERFAGNAGVVAPARFQHGSILKRLAARAFNAHRCGAAAIGLALSDVRFDDALALAQRAGAVADGELLSIVQFDQSSILVPDRHACIVAHRRSL